MMDLDRCFARILGMERGPVLRGVLIGAAIAFFTVLAYGALSDKLGRRPVYLWGAGFSLLFAFPFFWLVDTRSPFLIAVAITVGLAVGHAAMYGPQGAFMSELFGTRVRYSGASIGYQLASVLAGGLAPFVAVSLLEASGGEPWSVALYVIAICVVTLIAVLVATETNTSDIAEEGSPARSPSPEPGGQATQQG